MSVKDNAAREENQNTHSVNLPRRGPDYTNLWPIALAPVIPALGLALRGHPDPRARIGVPVGVAFAVLVFAHGFALSASSESK
jgi:hypothetical protein